MDTKCNGCGLVNWQGATKCSRCKGKLGVKPVTNLNPFEGESPKKVSGVRLAVLLGPALIGCLIVYQMVKIEELKPVKLSHADVEALKNSPLMLEYQKIEMQRQANMKPDYDVYKKAMKASDEYWQSEAGREQMRKGAEQSQKKYCIEHRGIMNGPPPGCPDYVSTTR